MERKVGEIFEYNGEWYQCVEQPKQYDCATVCELCSFNVIGNCDLDKCSGTYRSDSKSVIFKKLEKIKDPFVFNNMLYQRLKSIDNLVCAHCTFFNESCSCPSALCGSNLGYFLKTAGIKQYLKIKEDMKKKEDTKEEKLNLKKFDLEAAKAGKPVCTRDGRKARIISFDAKCNKPIVALIYDCNKETVLQYLENGRFFVDQIDKYDLMMLPEKKEGWVNVYKSYNVGKKIPCMASIYPTKEEAKKSSVVGFDYVDTVKIEWEE